MDTLHRIEITFTAVLPGKIKNLFLAINTLKHLKQQREKSSAKVAQLKLGQQGLSSSGGKSMCAQIKNSISFSCFS